MNIEIIGEEFESGSKDLGVKNLTVYLDLKTRFVARSTDATSKPQKGRKSCKFSTPVVFLDQLEVDKAYY